jgi:CRISPR-associated protein Csx14
MPLRDALGEILRKKSDDELCHLFTLTSPLTGRFGFDSVAAWSALDLGFSPNDQEMPVHSSPASELLAAIGIQRFRPVVSDDRQTISYATWSIPVGPIVAATMAGLVVSGGGLTYEAPVISRGQYAALGHAKPKQGVSNHVHA